MLMVLWALASSLCLASVAVEAAQYTAAAKRDAVPRFPGLPGPVSGVFSGYVGVDDKAGRELFYVFAEAKTSPDTRPLVLWLNGGWVGLLSWRPRPPSPHSCCWRELAEESLAPPPPLLLARSRRRRVWPAEPPLSSLLPFRPPRCRRPRLLQRGRRLHERARPLLPHP